SRHRGALSVAPNFALELCATRIDAADLTGIDLRSLRTLIIGSEPVRADTLARFIDAYAAYGLRRDVLILSYGMAEAVLFVSGHRRHGAPTVRHFDAQRLEAGVARLALGAERDERVRTLVGCGRPV